MSGEDAGPVRVMRSHEADEPGRPAGRAVDPGLAGLLHRPHDELIAGTARGFLDDSTASAPPGNGDRGPCRLSGKVNSGSDH